MTPRLLLIDNYDSFTYNLVQAFRVLGAEVLVYRNDGLTLAEAERLMPSHVVVSPGPGRPEGAGISLEVVDRFAGRVPLLGVCLGHQCIVQHYGGEIAQAGRLMHGKTSPVRHDGRALFEGLPNPFQAGRYHSLAARRASLPEVLTPTAETDDGEIMAVQHTFLEVAGVQFHPESVLTPEGPKLLGNFLRRTPMSASAGGADARAREANA